MQNSDRILAELKQNKHNFPGFLPEPCQFLFTKYTQKFGKVQLVNPFLADV